MATVTATWTNPLSATLDKATGDPLNETWADGLAGNLLYLGGTTGVRPASFSALFTTITTTSTSYVTIPAGAVTLTTLGGNVATFCWASATCTSASLGRMQAGLMIDAVDQRDGPRVNGAIGSSGGNLPLVFMDMRVLSAGSHTFTPRIRSTDGVSISVEAGYMLVVELR